MTDPIEVHAPLSHVMARCRTNFLPGSMEPNTQNKYTLHAVSQPMTMAEAESLMAGWRAAVSEPGWEFEICPADSAVSAPHYAARVIGPIQEDKP